VLLLKKLTVTVPSGGGEPGGVPAPALTVTSSLTDEPAACTAPPSIEVAVCDGFCVTVVSAGPWFEPPKLIVVSVQPTVTRSEST